MGGSGCADARNQSFSVAHTKVYKRTKQKTFTHTHISQNSNMQHTTRLHAAACEAGNTVDKSECVVARTLLSDTTADDTIVSIQHLEESNCSTNTLNRACDTFELHMDERRVFFERVLDGLVLNEKLAAQRSGHIQKTPACLQVEWRHLIDCLWHVHSVTHTQYQKEPIFSISDEINPELHRSSR